MRDTISKCDEDLLDGLARDLEGSFELLVRAYQDRLYGFALRITGNPSDAEEAAQDAFIRSYRALASYPPERIRDLALKPWLYRIALNVCRNRLRKHRLATVPVDGGEDDEDGGIDLPADAGQQPEVLFEHSETRAQLADGVSALPERYRVAVVLRFVQELSYAEAAAVLGQPVGTVKANVHRGIGLLRSAMSERMLVEAVNRRDR